MNPLTQTFDEADLSDLSTTTVMGEHLLLRMYPEREESEGGILLAETAIEKRTAAWVLSVGRGVNGMGAISSTRGESAVAVETPDYNPGDTVMCPTAALMNVLPELNPDGTIRYVMVRDVVLHWPRKE